MNQENTPVADPIQNPPSDDNAGQAPTLFDLYNMGMYAPWGTELMTPQGSLVVFRCKRCGSLVEDWETHALWHGVDRGY
jgi:hypothetical protein